MTEMVRGGAKAVDQEKDWFRRIAKLEVVDSMGCLMRRRRAVIVGFVIGFSLLILLIVMSLPFPCGVARGRVGEAGGCVIFKIV